MKIGLISDIHGNFEALTAVLNSLDKLEVDQIICLGDVVGYYPQINECCDTLRERKIPTVMGNHDWYMAAGSFCARSQSVNDCLAYLNTVITKENLDWLKSLPVHIELDELKALHGGWTDPIDEYVTPSKEYFSKITGKYFASGHTHRQIVCDFGDKIYCNPGSVGQPRDNDPRAAFATFDGNEFELHRVEYDMTVIYQLMDQAGFNDYYYGCLKTGASRLCKLENA